MTFILLIAVAYLMSVIAFANRVDSKKRKPARQYALSYPYRVDEIPVEQAAVAEGPSSPLRTIVKVMLLGIVAVLVLTAVNSLLLAFAPADTLQDAPITDLDTRTALTVTLVGIGAAIVCSVIILSTAARRALSSLLGPKAEFDSDASVHETAFVLAIAILAYTLMELMLAGGVAGLAENLEQQAIGAVDTLLNLGVMVVAAFLGVGLLVRRSLPSVMQRLSLRLPTGQDITWGIGTAFLCLVLVMVFSAVLSLIFSAETLEQQSAAAEQVARALSGSLTLIFLAAFSAAVGEEILFRGALQPVFGLIPTTIFFGLLHSQYAFTPGSAAILVVGLAFGILKQRQSTTAAIIAHFTYNFVLLGLLFIAVWAEEAGLVPDAVESMIYLTLPIIPLSA